MQARLLKPFVRGFELFEIGSWRSVHNVCCEGLRGLNDGSKVFGHNHRILELQYYEEHLRLFCCRITCFQVPPRVLQAFCIQLCVCKSFAASRFEATGRANVLQFVETCRCHSFVAS